MSFVSIRAPTRGAMRFTRSSRHWCLFQSAHPRRVRWQHIVRFARFECLPLHSDHKIDVIFGNPFPLTHPYVRPLREKTSRFYDHLRFTLELSFGLSHRHLCRGCKISVVRAKQPSFGQIHVTQPSDVFDLARQSTASPNLSLGLSTKHYLQRV